MKVLAIDPGATTGWCLYDTEARRVLDAGQFEGAESEVSPEAECAEVAVIERPVAHGPTRPQVVDCAWFAGLMCAWLEDRFPGYAHTLTRLEVKQALTAATHGEVHVKNDATAWAALKLLHGGEGCDRKAKVKKGVELEPAGPIGGVKSHERAALALAVAWDLIQRDG